MTKASGELRFLLKHSVVYGVGSALSRAVAFLLLPLYTRYLTPTDYGVLELIDATCTLVGAVIGLGIGNSLARFYYELDTDGRRDLVGTAYVLAFAGTAVAALPLLAGAPLFAGSVLDDRRLTLLVQVGFAGLLVGTVSDLGLLLLRMEYRSKLYVAISLFSLVFGVALNVLLIVRFGMGALGILVTTLVVRTVIAAPLSAFILARNGLRFRASMARDVLAYSLPLIPNVVVSMGSLYADRYFLKYFVSLSASGIYGLARKVSGAIYALLTAPFMSTFIPRRFEIALRPDAGPVFARVFDAFTIGLLTVATLLGIFSREIFVVMTTPGYYRAADVLPILLVEAVLLGSKYHVEFGILYAKKTKTYTAVNTVTAIVTIGMGSLLVPAFGMWGAASASVIGALIQVAVLHRFSKQYFPIPFAFQKHLLTGAVAAGLIILCRWAPKESLVVAISVKTAVFVAFLGVTVYVHGLRAAAVRDLIGMLRSRAGATVSTAN